VLGWAAVPFFLAGDNFARLMLAFTVPSGTWPGLFAGIVIARALFEETPTATGARHPENPKKNGPII
jgi:hypothetical protein